MVFIYVLSIKEKKRTIQNKENKNLKYKNLSKTKHIKNKADTETKQWKKCKN